MKTCYGGYCVEHKRGRGFSRMGPSAFKTFLVVVAIVTTLFVAADVLNKVSIDSYLTSIY